MRDFPSRRQYLLGLSTASITAIAGCSENVITGRSDARTTNEGDGNAPEAVARRYLMSLAANDEEKYDRLTYRNRTISSEEQVSISIERVEEVSLSTVAASKGYDLTDDEIESAREQIMSRVTEAGADTFAIVAYSLATESKGREGSGYLTLVKDDDRWFVFEDVSAGAILRKSSTLRGQKVVLAKSYTFAGSDSAVEKGTPLRERMMETPDSVLVYPEAKVGITEALIRLHRLDPNAIVPPTHVEGTASGYVAYSAICTHMGCTVGWDENGRPSDHCYCHGSRFDPYEGARVVQPPAERPLPQVSVGISDDGFVQLTSEFEGKVGP
ncbi:MAG: ubiquinol-cytochrome c reductase iron-sulfur subunit [Halanaeroarchaeum sp.]